MIEFSTIMYTFLYILALVILISGFLASLIAWFLEGDMFEDSFNDEHSNTDEAGKL